MRFAAFVLGALGGVFGLWLTVPTVVDVFGGTKTGPEWTAVLRGLLLVALLASLLAIAGAIMTMRRSGPAWVVLACSAIGMLVGLGWASGIGVPPTVVLAVAAVLANRSRAPRA